MLISQLPEEIKAKALKYQKDGIWNCDEKTNNLKFDFPWQDTREGTEYWANWCAMSCQ